MQTSDLSADSTMFLHHLEKHLTARLDLESLISTVLVSISPNPAHTITPSQVDLILGLNAFITDYVANSQFVIIRCAQALRPEVLSEQENAGSLDNAVGISYMSNVVGSLPCSSEAFSICLSLFADRLQIENSLFQNLKANPEKASTAGLRSIPHQSLLVSHHTTQVASQKLRS